MRRREKLKRPRALAAAAAGAVLLGSGVAVAAGGGFFSDDGPVRACAHRTTGDLRLVKPGQSCRPPEVAVSWAARGVAGPKGDPGTPGAPGPAGPRGEPGEPGPANVLADGRGVVLGDDLREVAAVELPAGRWILDVTADGDPDRFRCQVAFADSSTLVRDAVARDAGFIFERTFVTSVADTERISLSCQRGPTAGQLTTFVAAAIVATRAG